jgi:hypothetical protein
MGLFAAAPANAQSGQNSVYGAGNIDHGLVAGIIAGVAAIARVGITYLLLHNGGVVAGCIAESGGKRTLVVPTRRFTHFLKLARRCPLASAQS